MRRAQAELERLKCNWITTLFSVQYPSTSSSLLLPYANQPDYGEYDCTQCHLTFLCRDSIADHQ